MMVPSFPIPTDSLYKFMALSGVVVFLATFAVEPFRRQIGKDLIDLHAESEQALSDISRVQGNQQDVEAAIDTMDSFSQVLLRQLDEIYQEVVVIAEIDPFNEDTLLSTLQSVKGRTSELLNSLESIDYVPFDEIGVELAVIAESLERVNDRVRAIETTRQKIDLDIRFLSRVTRSAMVIRAFAVVLSVLGFFLWYNRLQRHVDGELARRGRPRKVHWKRTQSNRR